MISLNNMLQDLFDFAINLEPYEITDYFDKSKKYSVLFRLNSLRNSSALKNSPEEFVSIYYKSDTAIRQGQLLNLFDNGDTYLVLNTATTENNVYLKSDLAKCTTKIIIPAIEQNGISEKYIVPAYVENRLTQDKTKWIMTELSGVYQVFTTINEDTENKLKLGTYVHVMGMSCKVLEKYTIYDMFCLVLTRTATLQGIDVTDTINEPSENPSEPSTPTSNIFGKITYTKEPKIKAGYSKKFTAVFQNQDETVLDNVLAIWKHEIPVEIGNQNIQFEANGNEIIIKTNREIPLSSLPFMVKLELYCEENGIEIKKDELMVQITSLFG